MTSNIGTSLGGEHVFLHLYATGLATAGQLTISITTLRCHKINFSYLLCQKAYLERKRVKIDKRKPEEMPFSNDIDRRRENYKDGAILRI